MPQNDWVKLCSNSNVSRQTTVKATNKSKQTPNQPSECACTLTYAHFELSFNVFECSAHGKQIQVPWVVSLVILQWKTTVVITYNQWPLATVICFNFILWWFYCNWLANSSGWNLPTGHYWFIHFCLAFSMNELMDFQFHFLNLSYNWHISLLLLILSGSFTLFSFTSLFRYYPCIGSTWLWKGSPFSDVLVFIMVDTKPKKQKQIAYLGAIILILKNRKSKFRVRSCNIFYGHSRL